jgi:uncharacterized protein (DUF488 family)
MQPELFTAGYAGHDLDSFLRMLNEHSIETVIDIRRNPVSRKKGFSRSRLADFLLSHAIEYVHMRELGVPTELRDELRCGVCDLAEYLARFRDYLNCESHTLRDLTVKAVRKRCCLLCVESRHDECHRSVVAEAAAECGGQEIAITHLTKPL